MKKEDLNSQFKVVDMMATMHSIEADHYYFKSQFLDILIMAASSVLVALTFVDPKVLAYFSINEDVARISIGIFSVLVFILAMAASMVDWKGRARRHSEAHQSVVSLKGEWREFLYSLESHDDRYRLDFVRRSALIMNGLPSIRDSRFNRLKSAHHAKVILSKMVSAHPGSSVALLRIIIWYKRNRKALKADLPD